MRTRMTLDMSVPGVFDDAHRLVHPDLEFRACIKQQQQFAQKDIDGDEQQSGAMEEAVQEVADDCPIVRAPVTPTRAVSASPVEGSPGIEGDSSVCDGAMTSPSGTTMVSDTTIHSLSGVEEDELEQGEAEHKRRHQEELDVLGASSPRAAGNMAAFQALQGLNDLL